MPDGSLYPAAGQLLEGAGRQAQGNADLEQKKTDTTVDAGSKAGGELATDRQEISSQQAQMALEKMKASDKMQGKVITITPQIALGMSKNTGDPSWMQAIGQDMRSDVLMSLYTHGITKEYAKRSPKITQIYDGNGKIRHSVVYTDEQGNQQQLMLDEGITPENLNKGRGGGKKGGGGDDTLKKQEAFMKSHEKQAALINDASKFAQLKATNPEQAQRVQEEYTKDQDRYDQLKTQLGQAGGSGGPAAGGSQTPDNTPFDADALIKEALSQK